jgi:hypothetical protein
MSNFFLPIFLGTVSPILFSSNAFAQIPHVGGEWTISMQGQTRSVTLIQQGNSLTGTFRGDRGNIPLQGNVTNDNKVNFSGKSRVGSLRFAGTVDGETMQGVVDLPLGMGRKKWTATR